MNYSNQYYQSAKYSFNRKRQIIDAMCNDLHNIQMEMIENAVSIKEGQGFPEANQVINHVRSL